MSLETKPRATTLPESATTFIRLSYITQDPSRRVDPPPTVRQLHLQLDTEGHSFSSLDNVRNDSHRQQPLHSRPDSFNTSRSITRASSATSDDAPTPRRRLGSCISDDRLLLLLHPSLESSINLWAPAQVTARRQPLPQLVLQRLHPQQLANCILATQPQPTAKRQRL